MKIICKSVDFLTGNLEILVLMKMMYYKIPAYQIFYYLRQKKYDRKQRDTFQDIRKGGCVEYKIIIFRLPFKCLGQAEFVCFKQVYLGICCSQYKMAYKSRLLNSRQNLHFRNQQILQVRASFIFQT